MNIIADMHCHTIASTHAYSTIEEMAKGAKRANLYAVAITDHSRMMPGAPGKWYFENMVILPRFLDDVLLIRGIEANVVDYEGNLDIDENILSRVEWIVASMHRETISLPQDLDECTQGWLNVAKNPRVNVIGHSESEFFMFDYEKVIPEFGRNGKLVEINNNSFRVRSTAIPNCKKIAKLCKKFEVPVIVNSDAHCSYQVGKVDNALTLLKEIDFPENLIVNLNLDNFKNYLKKYTTVLEEECTTTTR